MPVSRLTQAITSNLSKHYKILLFCFTDGQGAIPDTSSLRKSGIEVHGSEWENTAAEKIAES